MVLLPRKIRRLRRDEIPDKLDSKAPVKMDVAGNIVQLTEYEKAPQAPPIVKLTKDLYMYTADVRDAETGEIVHHCGDVEEYKHIGSRAEDKRGVSRSLAKLRSLINANVSSPDKMRWVTLTYAENMTDSERLYEDFKNFFKRFCYYCGKHGVSRPEYIAVVEPQGRGAWHVHALLIWDSPAPYIDNNAVFQPLWGHGFTSVKAVRGDVDNLGAYFSAYLGDMTFADKDGGDAFHGLSDAEKLAVAREGCEVREVTDSSGKKKRVLKGARLHLYPPGINIFRTSRGVKRPTVEYVSKDEAKRKVGSALPTFQTALEVFDISEKTGKEVRQNKIVKRYYNLKSMQCQGEIEKKSPVMRRCSVCGLILPDSEFVATSPKECYCRECVQNWDKL